jgi:hypothetical protein
VWTEIFFSFFAHYSFGLLAHPVRERNRPTVATSCEHVSYLEFVKKNAVVFIYKTDSSGVFIPCCICKMQNEQTLCRLQQSLQPVLDFAVGVVPCRIPGILSPFLILPPSTVALLLEFPVLKLVSIRRRPWSFAAPHLPGGSQRTTELDSGPNGSTAPFLRAGGVPCSRRRFLPAAELPPLFPDELPARDGGAAAWPPGATH